MKYTLTNKQRNKKYLEITRLHYNIRNGFESYAKENVFYLLPCEFEIRKNYIKLSWLFWHYVIVFY